MSPGSQKMKTKKRIVSYRFTLREVETRLCDVVAASEMSAVTAEPSVIAAAVRAQFQLDHDPQENVIGVYLDSRGEVIGSERHFRGSVNHAFVSVREPVRTALLLNACGVILCHNHPSGNPSPSASDLAFTRELKAACKLFEIPLVDHIIIAGSNYVSLFSRGLL
jgi:DNA repair protein RadC